MDQHRAMRRNFTGSAAGPRDTNNAISMSDRVIDCLFYPFYVYVVRFELHTLVTSFQMSALNERRFLFSERASMSSAESIDFVLRHPLLDQHVHS